MINQIYSNITISLRLCISSPTIYKVSSGDSTSFRHLLVHVSPNQPNKLVEHFLSWAVTLSVRSLLRGPISIILSWSHFIFLTSRSCTLTIHPHTCYPNFCLYLWKDHGVHLVCSDFIAGHTLNLTLSGLLGIEFIGLEAKRNGGVDPEGDQKCLSWQLSQGEAIMASSGKTGLTSSLAKRMWKNLGGQCALLHQNLPRCLHSSFQDSFLLNQWPHLNTGHS